MPGLMKQVTHTDDCRRLQREVGCQRGCTSSEHTGPGIEFSTSASQVGASHEKVTGRGYARGGEEHAILAIPESMRCRLFQRDTRVDDWHRCRKGLRCCRWFMYRCQGRQW